MERFFETNPLDKIFEKIDINNFKSEEREILGDEAIELYSKYGVASFGNGLVQTIHPFKYQDLLKKWNLPDNKVYPIFKTSFGSIYYKTDKYFGYVDPVFKDIESEIDNLKVVMNIFLSDPEILKNACFKDIHDEVYPRLGLINSDEIYAFVPALALGGSRSPENVEKVKLREHFAFLSQL